MCGPSEKISTSSQFEESYLSKPPQQNLVYLLEWNDNLFKSRAIYDPNQLRNELKNPSDGFERLVVVHGLPADYVDIFRHDLGIQNKLLEAHAGLHRFQSSEQNLHAPAVTYEYPQRVENIGSLPAHVNSSSQQRPSWLENADLMDSALRHTVNMFGDQVLFCRASIWVSPKATVLLLNKPLCEDTCSPYGQTPSCVSAFHALDGNKTDTDNGIPNPWKMKLVEADVKFKNLEVRLAAILKETRGPVSGLPKLLTELINHHWTQLLDAIPLDFVYNVSNFARLHWQIQRSLERNLDFANRASHLYHTDGSMQPNWQALLDRAGRNFKLACSLVPLGRVQISAEEPGKFHNMTTRKEGNPNDNCWSPEENQRSLDRVSYLGGILLPMSIVSGIFSMGDPFGPTGDMFYIFWVISIPLIAITMLIIYADKIRKSEVWIDDWATMSGSETSSVHVTERPERPPTPHLEQVLPYNCSQPVTGDGRFRLAPIQIAQYKAWKRKELGWVGACKTILQIDDLQQMQAVPPGVRVDRREIIKETDG